MMKVYKVEGFTGMDLTQYFEKFFNTEKNAREYLNTNTWDDVLFFKEQVIAPNEKGELQVIEEKNLEFKKRG